MTFHLIVCYNAVFITAKAKPACVRMSRCAFYFWLNTNIFSLWQSFSIFTFFSLWQVSPSFFFWSIHVCIITGVLQTLQSRFSDSFSLPFVSVSLSFQLSVSHPSLLLLSSQRVFQRKGEGKGTWWLPKTQRKTAAGGGPQGRLLCPALTDEVL